MVRRDIFLLLPLARTRHLRLLQVLYPLVIFVTVWRTLSVRVLPDSLLVFRERQGRDALAVSSFAERADGQQEHGASDSRGSEHQGSGGSARVLGKLRNSWREERGLFACADRGQWETVSTTDAAVRREGDRFRIGFEPIFVDYSKGGAWYIILSLVKVSVCVW